jgi:hypothetical protein
MECVSTNPFVVRSPELLLPCAAPSSPWQESVLGSYSTALRHEMSRGTSCSTMATAARLLELLLAPRLLRLEEAPMEEHRLRTSTPNRAAASGPKMDVD